MDDELSITEASTKWTYSFVEAFPCRDKEEGESFIMQTQKKKNSKQTFLSDCEFNFFVKMTCRQPNSISLLLKGSVVIQRSRKFLFPKYKLSNLVS